MSIRHTLFTLLALSQVATLIAQEQITADSLPSRWTYESTHEQPLPVEDQWWKSFEDPTLDKIIEIGIKNNYNIAMAATRMAIARQSVNSAKANYYPSVGLNLGWTKARQSGNTTPISGPAQTVDYFSVGVAALWQVDLFGKISESVKQNKAQYNATKAEYAAAMVSLAAEIATDYINLRMLQEEEYVAKEHLQTQQKVLKITEARYEAGLASKLDVAQAKTVYNSTASTIPGLDKAIACNINAIGVLLGIFPNEVADLLYAENPALPDYMQIVATGVPADLIRRRPDIVEAEYSLAAAAAAVGIAKRDFLPALSIDGQIGYESHSVKRLFKNSSLTYSIAPKLTWTLFDGFARKSALISAKEQMQFEIDNYNLTLLTAVEEVENALITYRKRIETISLVEKVVKNSQEAFDLSIDLYKQGLSGFTDVANAQMSLLQYSDQLVTDRANAAAALVDLYRALGGGWNVEK